MRRYSDIPLEAEPKSGFRENMLGRGPTFDQ